MLKSKNVFWLIVSVAFNLAFLAALIYMSKDDRFRHRPPRYPENWTAEEKAKIDTMRHAFPMQIQGLRDSIAWERVCLAEVMRTTEPDTLAMHRHLHRIGEWQSAISEAVYRQFIRERDALLPEHRQEFVEGIVEHLTRSYRRSRSDTTRKAPPPPPPPES